MEKGTSNHWSKQTNKYITDLVCVIVFAPIGTVHCQSNRIDTTAVRSRVAFQLNVNYILVGEQNAEVRHAGHREQDERGRSEIGNPSQTASNNTNKVNHTEPMMTRRIVATSNQHKTPVNKHPIEESRS